MGSIFGVGFACNWVLLIRVNADFSANSSTYKFSFNFNKKLINLLLLLSFWFCNVLQLICWFVRSLFPKPISILSQLYTIESVLVEFSYWPRVVASSLWMTFSNFYSFISRHGIFLLEKTKAFNFNKIFLFACWAKCFVSVFVS